MSNILGEAIQLLVPVTKGGDNMAKILIALTSCVRDAQNGTAQAQRDTWLQDVAKYPDVTYKFFLGDGTPTGENEEPLRAMTKGAHDTNRGIDYAVKCTTGDAKPTVIP